VARHVIECRTVFPESGCTLLFVGEADEVITAFTNHAVDAHGREARGDLPGIVRDARIALQAAVFVGNEDAYIGERYGKTDEGGVTVPGPGFVMQRFNTSGGVEVNCSCLPADGKCDMTINGPILHCTRDTCTSCTVSAKIPGKLKDWLLT
jgi:hypothetical protein